MDSDFTPATNYKAAMSSAKKRLSNPDYLVLSGVFEHFKENANILYIDAKPKLIRRKKNLEEQSKKIDFDGLIKDIGNFYESNWQPEGAIIHLLVNTCDGNAGGGAHVKPKGHMCYSTLEPLYLGKENVAYSAYDLDVACHELIHPIEEHANQDKINSVQEVLYKKEVNERHTRILAEAIADTLFPNGILSVKYGLKEAREVQGIKNSNKRISMVPEKENVLRYIVEFRNRLSAEIYSLTTEQLENHKSIFEGDYLAQAVDKLIELKPTAVA